MHRMLCLLLLAGLTLSAARAEIIYVNAAATGGNNGSTWEDAYTNLHTALAEAVSGDQVWVAGGTYVAVDNVKIPSPFQIPTEVRLLGGFAGSEASFTDRPQPLAATILTADINGDDGPEFTNRADNGAEVVRILDGGKGTLLDGLVITAAEKTSGIARGAGVRINAGQVFVRDCHVHSNRNLLTTSRGAGLGINDGFLVLEQCEFENNHVQSDTNGPSGGAGVFVRNSFLSASNCTFVGNTVQNTSGSPGGAGLLVELTDRFAGQTTIRHCKFLANSATGGRGGGMAVALVDGSGMDLLLEDCQFDRNYADAAGAFLLDAGLVILPFSLQSTILLRRTEITNNMSDTLGGMGIFGGTAATELVASVTLDQCLIDNNLSRYVETLPLEGSAGAFLRGQEIYIRNTVFANNVVDSPVGAPPSAGARFFPGRTLLVENSAFAGNRMIRNSGINRLQGSSAAFMVSDFQRQADVTLRNVALVGNRGSNWPAGRIVNCRSVLLENVTIAGNRARDGGAGLNSDTDLVIRNSVVGGNRTGPILEPEIGLQLTGRRGGFELYDCVFERLGGGYGMVERTIEADPRFADTLGPDGLIATGDESFALQPGSPCIDRGNNAWLPADDNDLDNDGDVLETVPFDVLGNPRRVDQRWVADLGQGTTPLVDIGAYEYQWSCPGDFDADGVIGISDLSLLLNRYGQTAEEASDEFDIQPNGLIDLSDLATMLTVFGNSCD